LVVREMLYKARYYPVNKGRSNAGGIIHLRSADGFCEQNLTLTSFYTSFDVFITYFS
jgi:hypothetical protein